MNEQIVYIGIDELVPYENNPRVNDEAVQYLVASIKAFGFRQPIIVDEDNVIICGHTRLMAAKELGMDSVPCIRVTDLNEEQKKAYRLADNKTAEMSTWDWSKLEQELGSIDMSVCNFDMTDFGFDSSLMRDFGSTAEDDTEATAPMEHQNEYKEYDENIETSHKCPMCGYEW